MAPNRKEKLISRLGQGNSQRFLLKASVNVMEQKGPEPHLEMSKEHKWRIICLWPMCQMLPPSNDGSASAPPTLQHSNLALPSPFPLLFGPA